MANYTIEEGVNFLSNFAKAEQMNYLGESCILVAHDAFEKSKLDIEETFLNGKRKKVLTYDNNPNIILVTPLLEAPFGCSSFDGSKFSMPLSIPTSKNKYTHPDIDLNKVASFKKLLAYLDKQVRTSQEWNQMSNYLPGAYAYSCAPIGFDTHCSCASQDLVRSIAATAFAGFGPNYSCYGLRRIWFEPLLRHYS